MKNQGWLALGIIAAGLIYLNRDKVSTALNLAPVKYPNTPISNTGLPYLNSTLPMLENPIPTDVYNMGISYV
jgi:hypothetical protein